MKELLLIVNPCAGQRRVNRSLTDIVALFNADGWQTEVYTTAASGDAVRYIQERNHHWDMIVCAGGDGTLNETISGTLAASLSCPLGYIPCGTTNDYATSIGLSNDVIQAARDIIGGTAHPFDIGAFNGRYFVYTATCGAFARTSYATSQAAKNVLGHAAYILEGIKDVAAIRPIHMHIETNEVALDDDYLFCSITNSTSVGGILKLDSALVELNDGQFEVMLVRNPTNPGQLSSILVGLSTMDVPNDMVHFFSTNRLTVHTDEPIEWTLDGERADEVETAQLQNLHSAVQIVLPKENRQELFTAEETDAEL